MNTLRQFTAKDLDHELARRQRYPPASLRFGGFREEWLSLTALRAELDATPETDPDRSWREWEVALAERQAEHFPDRLFYRVVHVAAA